MLTEEEKRILAMEQDIGQIKRDLGSVTKNVDKLVMYVVGDENSKDVSMLARIKDLEKENIEKDKKLQELKDNQQKDSIYVKIMWGMAGAIGVALIGLVVYMLKGGSK